MTQIGGISSSAVNVSIPSLDTAKATTEDASSGVLGFFGNLLDVVNPLQHIPIISSAYRAITGDTISSVANIAGGFLFGGPIGAGAAAASEVAQAALGDSKSSTDKASLNDLNTASGTQMAANNAYKMRVTTHDWIYPSAEMSA